jgi:hypothetical protein
MCCVTLRLDHPSLERRQGANVRTCGAFRAPDTLDASTSLQADSPSQQCVTIVPPQPGEGSSPPPVPTKPGGPL